MMLLYLSITPDGPDARSLSKAASFPLARRSLDFHGKILNDFPSVLRHFLLQHRVIYRRSAPADVARRLGDARPTEAFTMPFSS